MDEYMTAALKEARTDAREGGIRIGAIPVNVQGTVVATGLNRPLKKGACVMRGEINCLLSAGRKLFSLLGMTMYSTRIPNKMCAGVFMQFGIIEEVYGESRNLPEDNSREILVRYGIDLTDLDHEESWRIRTGPIISCALPRGAG